MPTKPTGLPATRKKKLQEIIKAYAIMSMWDVVRATLQEHHQRIVKASSNQAKRRFEQILIANGKEEESEHHRAAEGAGAAINHDLSVKSDLKAPTSDGARESNFYSVAASFPTRVTTNAPKHATAHLKDPPSNEVIAASATDPTANAKSNANNDKEPNLATTWKTAKSSSRNHRSTNLSGITSSSDDSSVKSELKAPYGVHSEGEPDAPFSTAIIASNDATTNLKDSSSHELMAGSTCLTANAESAAKNNEGQNLVTTVESSNLSNQSKKDEKLVNELNVSKPDKPAATNLIQGQNINGRPLSAPNDSSHLSPLHCYIRQHCLEYVIASSPRLGLKPVYVGMVGLQCVFCKNEEERASGGVSFPGSIEKIVNSVLNLLYRHVSKCQFIPKDIKKKIKKFRESEIRDGGLPHVVESAREIGLVDTNIGIFVHGSGMVNSGVELTMGDAADGQYGVAPSYAGGDGDIAVSSSLEYELDSAKNVREREEEQHVISGTSLDRQRNARIKAGASYQKTKSGKYKRLCKVAGCEKQGRRRRDDMCKHHYRMMIGEVQFSKQKWAMGEVQLSKQKWERDEVTNSSEMNKKAKVNQLSNNSCPEATKTDSRSPPKDDVPANIELPAKMDQSASPRNNSSGCEVSGKPTVRLTYSCAIEYIRKTKARKSCVAVGEVGHIFHKEFETGFFTGVVVKIRHGAEKGKDRRCVYEDGDVEDLSIAELETLAELLPKNQFEEDLGDDSKLSASASKRKHDVTKSDDSVTRKTTIKQLDAGDNGNAAKKHKIEVDGSQRRGAIDEQDKKIAVTTISGEVLNPVYYQDDNTREKKWTKSYNELKAYLNNGGTWKNLHHFNYVLSRWVSIQRSTFKSGKLLTTRKQKLDEIEFVYSARVDF